LVKPIHQAKLYQYLSEFGLLTEDEVV